MRRLIVTCDDCGLSEGINLATIDLYKKSIVTSASVMMNFPAAKHALELFLKYPSLDTGVHLNLTDGIPLSDIRAPSDLTDSRGRLRPRPHLFAHALLPSQSFLTLVRKELQAQIAFFSEQLGRSPTHLTTHIHFHMFRSLRHIVFNLAHEHKVIWIRSYTPRSAVLPLNLFLKKQVQPSSAQKIRMPDYIVGIKYWMSRSPQQLLEKLISLEGDIEIVVHPCFSEDPTYPTEIYYSPHERHAEVLYLEKLSHLIRNDNYAGFQIGTFNKDAS